MPDRTENILIDAAGKLQSLEDSKAAVAVMTDNPGSDLLIGSLKKFTRVDYFPFRIGVERTDSYNYPTILVDLKIEPERLAPVVATVLRMANADSVIGFSFDQEGLIRVPHRGMEKMVLGLPVTIAKKKVVFPSSVVAAKFLQALGLTILAIGEGWVLARRTNNA